MTTNEYLDAIKAKHNYRSDYVLARALRVASDQVSKYRKRGVVPGPLVAARIAQLLGEQEVAVIMDLERERAANGGKAEEAAEWSTIIRKIGGGAASVLLAAAVGVLSFGGADLARSQSADSLYIV
jgi:hypothetical protein